jgi:hypothetical protein
LVFFRNAQNASGLKLKKDEFSMKKYVIAVIGLSMASFCFAEGEADLQPLMKSVVAANGKLRKDAEAKASADITKDAEQLEATYKQIAAVFAKLKMDDAVKIAHSGEAAAKDLTTSSADPDKVDASVKAIGATCGSCHMVHREKTADGTYKVK